MLCQTCSSTIPPSAEVTAWRTECCQKLICHRCISLNPRLKAYDPCLYCGDLISAQGLDRVRRGRERVNRESTDRENVFVIDDEDDEDQKGDGRGNPPAYEDHLDRSEGGVPHPNDEIPSNKSTGRDGINDDQMEEVEVRHPVSRGDTILTIARRYGADVSDCTIDGYREAATCHHHHYTIHSYISQRDAKLTL